MYAGGKVCLYKIGGAMLRDPVREGASAELPLLDAEDLYHRLERFIWWRAHQMTSGNINHVLLEPDDVASEMFLTLVECWEKYHDREDIDAGAMLRIVRKSCDNKCAKLVVKYYKTKSRKNEIHQISIEEILEIVENYGGWPYRFDDQPDMRIGTLEAISEGDIEALLESQNRISRFIELLTDREAKMVIAILKTDERIARRAHLESVRRAFVHPRAGPLTLNYRLIADALHMAYGTASKTWYSIRKKWQDYQSDFEKGD